ncbi:MAG: hypothetical protein M3071_00790, partial [Actinomycetota bacterium]|nr:hypothetical protein [Actinomycetota bacterium]
APGGAGLFTAPAVWTQGGRTWLFAADFSSTAAYSLSGGSGQPHLVKAWEASKAGTSPIVAGGLLYVYDPNGGTLEVYRPTTGQLLHSLAVGSGHWSSPIILGGRIVLPAGNANDHASTGVVVIYHQPGR